MLGASGCEAASLQTTLRLSKSSEFFYRTQAVSGLKYRTGTAFGMLHGFQDVRSISGNSLTMLGDSLVLETFG